MGKIQLVVSGTALVTRWPRVKTLCASIVMVLAMKPQTVLSLCTGAFVRVVSTWRGLVLCRGIDKKELLDRHIILHVKLLVNMKTSGDRDS